MRLATFFASRATLLNETSVASSEARDSFRDAADSLSEDDVWSNRRGGERRTDDVSGLVTDALFATELLTESPPIEIQGEAKQNSNNAARRFDRTGPQRVDQDPDDRTGHRVMLDLSLGGQFMIMPRTLLNEMMGVTDGYCIGN